MARSKKGTIYLEPRSTFDKALIDVENIIYSLDKILEVLMDHQKESFPAIGLLGAILATVNHVRGHNGEEESEDYGTI